LPEDFYCSEDAADTFGFDLASTCPDGEFAPLSVYPPCDDINDGADEDSDGIADPFDDCPGTEPLAAVNNRGCSDDQVDPERNDSETPYSLDFSSSGDMGRSGGTTWEYDSITRGQLFHIYWVLSDALEYAPYGISLDGAVMEDETWTLVEEDSDLGNGVAVFYNSTNIHLASGALLPLEGRMTVTVSGGGMPLAWQTVGALGITPEVGEYGVEVPGTSLTVEAIQLGALPRVLRFGHDAARGAGGVHLLRWVVLR
jgi:hypothetical protein